MTAPSAASSQPGLCASSQACAGSPPTDAPRSVPDMHTDHTAFTDGIHTLTEVCAWCARTRQADGTWEVRLITTDVWGAATHGVCPDCLADLFADLGRDLDAARQAAGPLTKGERGYGE